MTTQEAIDWCEQFRDNIIKVGVKKEKYTLALKAMRTAITALVKQMPKKPYYRKEEDTEGYACPVCHMGVTVDHGRIKDTFCSHCGQVLDWSGDNG